MDLVPLTLMVRKNAGLLITFSGLELDLNILFHTCLSFQEFL